MTTRPLDLTQRQITALCKGAAKAGYVPVVRIGKTFVQLVPDNHDILQQDDGSIDRGKDIRL